MSREQWVRREAEYLVQQYESVGLISSRQSEMLIHLVEDGQANFALQLIRAVAATTRET